MGASKHAQALTRRPGQGSRFGLRPRSGELDLPLAGICDLPLFGPSEESGRIFRPSPLGLRLDSDLLGQASTVCPAATRSSAGPIRTAQRDRLADVLEAPWKGRVERGLRAVFTPEEAGGAETPQAIVDFVKSYGLQPWKAPEPLVHIEVEDVVLVVWMAVESGG